MTKVKISIDEATIKKMRAVRQAGTVPEIAVRETLNSLSIEFVANAKDKPGRPDLWLTQHEVAIFVHGCFWHRHQGCRKATMPKTNLPYWTSKFKQNVERDARKIRDLAALGYPSVVIWQCETTDRDALGEMLMELITAARK